MKHPLWHKFISLFDVPRLHRKIEELEVELLSVRNRPHPPSFTEVSKPIQWPDDLRAMVNDRLVEEFSTLLRGEALCALTHLMKKTQPDREARYTMAFAVEPRHYVIRATLPEVTAEINVSAL